MEQQLKQCPKTGTYYYVDIPDENDAEEVVKAQVEPPKPKMGRPPKKQR